MRVAWVHPSWRDLVIEFLADNDEARERFLRGCSIHGALLALSVAGGQAGERRLPLLKRDQDWDALTDCLHELAPAVEPAELIGLLDGVARTVQALRGAAAEPEADALARALLTRVNGLWKAARAPIPLSELEGWLAVAERLSPKPPPPSIAVTWVELLPAGAPDISEHTTLERFADWLTLADLLFDHDPELLHQLGFPGPAREFIVAFLNALGREFRQLPSSHTELVSRALARIPKLVPSLGQRADDMRYWLGSDYQQPSAPAAPPPRREKSGRLDIERVLSDL